jgi:hypothetical protein
MAKISARGATELLIVVSDRDADGYGVRAVLCSDGRILWRLVGNGCSGGYKVTSKLTAAGIDQAKADPQAFVRYIARRLNGTGWRLA